MKLQTKSNRFKCKFDFEVGHLVKSPCRDCEQRKTAFPACSEQCATLAQVQGVISNAVSCAKKS
ncbi:MAG TPA: hypothetical protein ACFCUC_06335 [Desulfobacterales bacterium]|jgi:hypothetical protein